MAASSTLAIDCGTTSVRAILYDECGAQLSASSRAVGFLRSGPVHYEQDPGELLAAARAVAADLLRERRLPASVGIAVQRSSVAFWDADGGSALAPVIGWQDTRAAERVAALAPHAAQIRERSGLRLSPHYGATKLDWAQRNLPAIAAARADGRLRMGPLAAWLLRGLSSGAADLVDHVNASRTQLWNLERRDWDPRLCELFRVDAGCLPTCLPVRSDYGELAEAAVPVTALSGDQNAALFANGSLPTGTLCVNLGTGAFALLATGSRLLRGDGRLLSGVADSDADGASYLLEGTVNGAGAALLHVETEHGLAPIAPRIDALCAGGADPLLYMNAVGGLGSPWWRSDLRSGAMAAGAEARSLREDGGAALALGAVESVLFLLKANFDLLARAAGPADSIRVSGGLAASGQLCRRLASLAGMPVERPAQREATARGIAWLAAGRPDGWRSREREIFEPLPDLALRGRYESWLAAMAELA